MPKMFKLTSDSNEGFSNRSKDIFAGIDDLASKTRKKDNCKEDSGSIVDKANDNATEDKQKATQDFKGRESIFRSPNETGWPPASKSNKYRRDRSERKNHHYRRGHKTPDHVANPDKYTKYSLSDVSKDQISDRSNTRAAFDFLRELKDRKGQSIDECISMNQSASSPKVTFKKPKKSHQDQQQLPSTSVVQDGVKRVMPECVVGQKRRKENDKSATTVQIRNKKPKHGQVALSHLDDDEDDV